MSISASIVLYKNTPAEINHCIESLKITPIKKIFIVDNSPTSNLKPSIPQSELIQYEHRPGNPGYGAGHNVAIRQSIKSGYLYHLVINADVSFDEDIISPLSRHFDSDPRLGAAMPKIVYPSGEVQQLCKFIPSPYDLFVRRFLPDFLKARNEFKFKMMGYDKGCVLLVPYLSGCFMFIRNAAISKVGMFDERFFMYPEDIDLSRRIHKHFDTKYFPDLLAVHRHDEAHRKSFYMLFILIINMVTYFNKWGWFRDIDRRILNQNVVVRNQDYKIIHNDV